MGDARFEEWYAKYWLTTTAARKVNEWGKQVAWDAWRAALASVPGRESRAHMATLELESIPR